MRRHFAPVWGTLSSSKVGSAEPRCMAGEQGWHRPRHSPESTAWTRTGESQQMVKPKPSFPLGMVI